MSWLLPTGNQWWASTLYLSQQYTTIYAVLAEIERLKFKEVRKALASILRSLSGLREGRSIISGWKIKWSETTAWLEKIEIQCILLHRRIFLQNFIAFGHMQAFECIQLESSVLNRLQTALKNRHTSSPSTQVHPESPLIHRQALGGLPCVSPKYQTPQWNRDPEYLPVHQIILKKACCHSTNELPVLTPDGMCLQNYKLRYAELRSLYMYVMHPGK